MNNQMWKPLWKRTLPCVLSMVALVAVLILQGCGGNGNGGTPPGDVPPGEQVPGATNIGNGMYLEMQADLSGAKSLTTPTDGPKKLLKVSEDNKLSDVLSGPHEIRFWKETKTHVIAEVEIWEGQQRCSLIAIPKVQDKSKVLCLNRQRLTGQYNTERKTRPQFDVRGNEVFFAYFEANREASGYEDENDRITELRHWDGASESVSTIYHSDRKRDGTADVAQVFASTTNSNLCFALSAQNWKNNGSGSEVYCREGDDKEWRLIKDLDGDQTTVKWGNWVFFRNPEIMKLNLETLAVERRPPSDSYQLPDYVDYKIGTGGFVGHTDKEVMCVSEEGKQTHVATVDSNTQLVRNGDFAWFNGSHTLRRLDLRDCTLDAQEYYSNLTLLSISHIAWSLGDFLRVDGISRTVGPATNFLSDTGNLVLVEAPSIAIEHPIDLKWDL